MGFSEKRKIKNDILLGMGLLLAALCLWLVMGLMGKNDSSKNKRVVITVDGGEYGSYSLNTDTVIYVNEHNMVVIRDGAVWMEEADCPDRLCINQGKIKNSGQTIICLPNRVMVTIKGGEAEYDGVAE